MRKIISAGGNYLNDTCITATANHMCQLINLEFANERYCSTKWYQSDKDNSARPMPNF